MPKSEAFKKLCLQIATFISTKRAFTLGLDCHPSPAPHIFLPSSLRNNNIKTNRTPFIPRLLILQIRIITTQRPTHRRRLRLTRLDPTTPRIQHIRIPRPELPRRRTRASRRLSIVRRLSGRAHAVRVPVELEVARAREGVEGAGLPVVRKEEFERARLVDGRGGDLEIEDGAEVVGRDFGVARRPEGVLGPVFGDGDDE